MALVPGQAGGFIKKVGEDGVSVEVAGDVDGVTAGWLGPGEVVVEERAGLAVGDDPVAMNGPCADADVPDGLRP